MKETFDYSYASSALAEYMQTIKNPGQFQNMSIAVEGGFGPFNLRDGFNLISRLSTDPQAIETVELQERIAKQCLMKRAVNCIVDGKDIGGQFVITSQDNMFEAFPVIQENPGFYNLILTDCTAHVLKKSSPQRKQEVPELEPEAASQK